MNPTLLILIGGHLALAPRPQKEAASAKKAGFHVIVRGVWWDSILAAEDLELASRIGIEFAPVVDLRDGGVKARLFRMKQRLARDLYQKVGVVSCRSFGLAAPEFLREALALSADLTMVHSEAGLWIGDRLLRRGFKVGVDFEDWFSEDLPLVDRKGRPIAAIKRLERRLLVDACPTLSTTRVLSEALANDAGSSRIPTVIPNCFPWSEAPRDNEGPSDIRDSGAISFYWFSQTIGPGRGLETLARSLLLLRGDWELHLRGDLRNYGKWFEETFPAEIRNRVKLQPLVSNLELPPRSASHDVGLALEEPHCPSRDLTATNKIFEYLRCGLAVIATSTRGQIEIMERCPQAGWIVPPCDERALTTAMQWCLDNRGLVNSARSEAKRAASGIWAWERFDSQLGEALLAAVAS